MKKYRFVINVTDLINDFNKNMYSIKNHDYNIENIFRMIVNSYKKDSHLETTIICKYASILNENSLDYATDSQITLNSILLLRNKLFDLLNNYSLINKRNEDNQYPVNFTFKQLKYDDLIIEYEH